MESKKIQPVEWHEIKLDDGDDLKKRLLEWAEEKNVLYAWVQLVGEIRNSKIVSGYKTDDTSADKISNSLEQNGHFHLTGTISRDPRDEVHLHGSIGRDDKTWTGCWAANPVVFRGMSGLITVFRKTE